MSETIISQNETNKVLYLNSSELLIGQTFVPPYNILIESIDIYIYNYYVPEGGHTISIYVKEFDTVTSEPIGDILAQDSVVFSTSGSKTLTFGFDTPPLLSSSKTYIFYCQSDTANSYYSFRVDASSTDYYVDGSVWDSVNGLTTDDLKMAIYGTLSPNETTNDLIIYIPGHEFDDGDEIYLPGMEDPYYIVYDPQTDYIKIKDSDGNIIQYDPNIKIDYVQLSTDTTYDEITGLNHLIGQTVYVTSGGESLGKYVVDSDGKVTLTTTIGNYIVGLPYKLEIQSMRLSEPGQPTIQSRTKRIHELVSRVVRARNGEQGRVVRDTIYLQPMNAQYSNESKDITTKTIQGYDSDGKFVIRHSTPEPFSVIGTVISYEVNEKR